MAKIVPLTPNTKLNPKQPEAEIKREVSVWLFNMNGILNMIEESLENTPEHVEKNTDRRR
ncbi:MAG: hypothetical protein P1U56_07485 [Saprospiraceae bacterium]|nr:hypothetical protein [Saprospiraceae bacterium]